MNASRPLRWLPSPGVRAQLTLWYTAIFACLLLIAGTLLYLHLRDSLAASLDSALQLRSQQIAGYIGVQRNQIVLDDVITDLPGFGPGSDDPLQSSNDSGTQADVNFATLVRLLDPYGHVLHTTPAFARLPVPQASVTQPLQGTPWQGTIISASGQPVRLYSRTLSDEGRVFALLQVGESLDLVQHALEQVTTELMIAALGVLLLGALGSYWLAGRAFAPIRRLIEVTRTIKEGDLHQRVPVPQTADEVQALALTFNEMLTSLEATLNRQRRFVSDASHELRTPVAVIRSKTDLALQQPGDEREYLAVLHEINSESERLGRLIGDLLVLARGDEGKTHFESESVALHQVAEAVAASAEPLAHEHGVHLQVEIEQPATVLGDEARLIQVIMNLLDNAIRYTNTGGCVSVHVTCTWNEACLTVRDTGIGIAPEHLPHIFERFYRVDSARTFNCGNNGLGLAIADWIVRAHHGTLAASSQPGQGSTFSVRLPLHAN
jgi:heavy metal sensor kinase